ncbi:hypothetical protein [Streptomyces yangpuensis]|uniref:hypothetical protein n=1 Tax=Streptomyces yangpuensis TaxID=1648182 RepID=UPI0036555799
MTSGYPPLPEPFSAFLGVAAHTTAMACRLVLAVSDVVRRAALQRLAGRDEDSTRTLRRWSRAGRPTARPPW